MPDTAINLPLKNSNGKIYVLDLRPASQIESDLIAAKNAGIKRFIYASTSSVYGLSKEKYIKESLPPASRMLRRLMVF